MDAAGPEGPCRSAAAWNSSGMRWLIALVAVVSAFLACSGCEGLESKETDRGKIDRMMDSIQNEKAS